MTAAIDITKEQRKTLLALLRRFIPGVAVWAYGSRVKWTARPNSDLDLVAFTTPAQSPLVAELKEALGESNLPFLVDFHIWDEVPERFHEIIRKEYVVLQDAKQPEDELSIAAEVRHFGQMFAESTRNGLTRPKAVRGIGVKMVNMGELFAYPRLCNAPMDRVPLNVAEAERFLLAEGDLLFARQSLVLEGAGKCSIFLRDAEPVTFESHITRVRLDANKGDALFYFYYMQSNHGRAAIRSIVEQGAGASGIRGSDLKELNVLWRPIEEQRTIARVLGTLDDKIELNRQMNATLETMARALFQSWFVDFDPVCTKLDGRKLAGLDAATAVLFPAHFQDSPLGHIPQGWEVRSLDQIAHFLNGLALQKYPPGDGATLPVIKIAQLRKGDSEGADRCNTELAPQYIIEDGDVLFSWSGSLEVELWCGGRGALNQHLFKVTSPEFPKWFYYLWTLYHLDEFRLIAAGKATTMGHIQRGHLTAAKVLVPLPDLLKAMNLIMAPLIDQIISNRTQSRTLATIRDALLPKLLSGELRVAVGAEEIGVVA